MSRRIDSFCVGGKAENIARMGDGRGRATSAAARYSVILFAVSCSDQIVGIDVLQPDKDMARLLAPSL